MPWPNVDDSETNHAYIKTLAGKQQVRVATPSLHIASQSAYAHPGELYTNAREGFDLEAFPSLMK